MNITPLSNVKPSSPEASTARVNDGVWSALFSQLVSGGADPLASVSPLSPVPGVAGLSASGRNLALADPEAAYRMMSLINNVEVQSRAQYAELTRMKTGLQQMQDAGVNLASADGARLKVLGFVTQYNNWIARFAPDLQPGGLLAGTRAAQISRYELEQNFNNRFFGADDGVHGMGDLGVSIDPVSHLASVDTAKLDAMLASNRGGVADTLKEFGSNFAKSAGMLVSDGNFVQRQLDNLSRAIHFIYDNKASLQQEFGTGDAPRPVAADGLAAGEKS